jgi:hypothetical protein
VQAWESWVQEYHHPEVRNLITGNRHQTAFRYNEHRDRIVPKYKYHNTVVAVHQRGYRSRDRGLGSIQEISRLSSHPLQRVKRENDRNFVTSDEFSKIHEHSEMAMIGEFIKLDIAPKMLHIKIFKGITDKGLSILADRLVQHAKTGETKIMLKRSVKKGKYTYTSWLTVKDLKGMSKEELLKRLLTLTKEGSRVVQIIVRQNVEKGFIQDLWARKHSLL